MDKAPNIQIFTTVKTILLCCFLLLLNSCISHYIGYNRYQKWKYRRSTFGNKTESLNRNVFIKDLEYSSNIKLDSFHVYIEKGFKYSRDGGYHTILLDNDTYPYQICYNIFIDNLNIYGYETSRFDSKIDTISSVFFLKKPVLKTPFMVKISKLENNKWDSIGYIKVWDPDKN